MFRMHLLVALLVGFFATTAVFFQEVFAAEEGEQTWIVNDYRYVPGSDQDDEMMGLSLCGTRCNALTTDYRNIIDARGFRFIRVARDRELTVPLDNPFIGGHCVCIADEYRVRLNEFDGRGQNRQK